MKPIEIGYENDVRVVFYPRMITVAEEESVAKKLRDAADEEVDRYKNEFEVCREALGKFSEKMPERCIEEAGEVKRVPLTDDKTPEKAVIAYFAERTPQNERIVRDAYFLFRQQLSPNARFL